MEDRSFAHLGPSGAGGWGMSRRSRTVSAGLSLCLGLAIAGGAGAHDFWLIPNAFEVAEGQDLVVTGRTSSSFPRSLSAVTPDRVADARILDSEGSLAIALLDVQGEQLRLRARPRQAGNQIVAVQIHPRLVPESAESFRNYLVLEGAPEALARYEAEGILPTDSVVRRYAKYAKTLVQVGEIASDSTWGRRAGHPLEFVPLDDPGSGRATLRFQLLLNGEPVPDQPVHAGYALSASDSVSAVDRSVSTDGMGVVELNTQSDGIWNVRTLVIVPASEGADWDVHWATFVWRTRNPS